MSVMANPRQHTRVSSLGCTNYPIGWLVCPDEIVVPLSELVGRHHVQSTLVGHPIYFEKGAILTLFRNCMICHLFSG